VKSFIRLGAIATLLVSSGAPAFSQQYFPADRAGCPRGSRYSNNGMCKGDPTYNYLTVDPRMGCPSGYQSVRSDVCKKKKVGQWGHPTGFGNWGF
jgi:hypothetical protein